MNGGAPAKREEGSGKNSTQFNSLLYRLRWTVRRGSGKRYLLRVHHGAGAMELVQLDTSLMLLWDSG